MRDVEPFIIVSQGPARPPAADRRTTLLDRFSKRRRDIYDALAHFRAPMIALILVNTFGVMGFMIFNDYPFHDAVYQTVFTLATVGYGETHPISDTGKLFVIVLITGGVAVWTYALGVTIRVIANEDLWGKVSEAFMESRIQKLEGHFIVAGYTDIGRQVARMFARQKIPFMILDDDSHRLNLAEQDHIPFVLPLNPFLNDSFRRANVAQARGIISSFSDDSDNITVVVTAKIMEEEINRKLLVITVARHQESRAKLTKVGAEVVILPSELIGQRISALAMHPPDIEQSSFLDRVAFGEFRDLDIREVFIKETSALNGVTLRESGIRNTIGAHIVGIQRRGKRRFYLMPSPDVPIRSGDLLLIMGTATQLSLLPGFLEKGPEEQEAALPSESKKPPRKNSKWLLTTESPAPSQPDIPPDDPTLKKKET